MCTGERLGEMWRELEDRVDWGKRVNRLAPTG